MRRRVTGVDAVVALLPRASGRGLGVYVNGGIEGVSAPGPGGGRADAAGTP